MKPTSGSAPSPFGLGTAVFGQSDPESTAKEDQHESTEDDADSEGEEDDDDELITAMASTSLENSEWSSVPAYDPLYLSTFAEYVPPAPKAKIPKEAQMVSDDVDLKAKDGSWALEGYENSLEVDHVFERFTKRVGYEGEQCIRWVYTLFGYVIDDMFILLQQI